MFKKEIKPIISYSIIIILALAIFLGGFCYLKNNNMEWGSLVVRNNQDNNQNQTTSSSDKIDASEWKTYRNEEYNIRLQYPKSLTVSEKKLEVIYPSLLSQIKFEGDNNEYKFHINVYDSNYLSFDNFNDWYNKNVVGNELSLVNEIKIGDYNAIETIEVDGIDASGLYIYLINNNYTINFRIENNATDKEFLLKQILPTFKFENEKIQLDNESACYKFPELVGFPAKFKEENTAEQFKEEFKKKTYPVWQKELVNNFLNSDEFNKIKKRGEIYKICFKNRRMMSFIMYGTLKIDERVSKGVTITGIFDGRNLIVSDPSVPSLEGFCDISGYIESNLIITCSSGDGGWFVSSIYILDKNNGQVKKIKDCTNKSSNGIEEEPECSVNTLDLNEYPSYEL